MESLNWTFNEHDKKIVDRYVNRLPENIMDVHIHIYRKEDIGLQGSAYNDGPDFVSIEVYKQNIKKVLGDVPNLRGVFVAPPTQIKEQIIAANEYTIKQLETEKYAKGLVLISPDMNRDIVEEYLKNDKIIGIKPFATYSSFEPDYEAPILEFLPEWAFETAHEHSLLILAHIMTKDALSNPENYNAINKMCTKYTDCRLMLDHAARGFHTDNTVKGLEHIKHLDNVYFDTSSVCDPMVIIAVIKAMGHEKLVFGTDFPLGQLRGKSVSLGDGFVWVLSENFDFCSCSHLCNPVLLGIESIKSLFDAVDALELSSEQINDIFYNNATRMISG